MTASSPALAARRAMIDSQLRPENVSDPRVLAAMAATPREDHVPEALAATAYLDRSVPLGDGAALMPPAAMGRLLQALDVQPGERALLVSRAPGYAAALLGALGASVDAVSDSEAASGTVATDYDVILLDGAAADLPAELTDRLAPGGRLAGGLSERGVTRLAIGRRGTAGAPLGLVRIADADVPALAAFDRPKAFQF